MHDSTTEAAHHAQKPPERGTQEPTATTTGQHSGQGRAGGNSRIHRCVSIGASGEARKKGIEAGEKRIGVDSITGGILSQLIEMLNDRLAETKDCIQWYEREEEKIHRQLANLTVLQAQHQEQELHEEQDEDS